VAINDSVPSNAIVSPVSPNLGHAPAMGVVTSIFTLPAVSTKKGARRAISGVTSNRMLPAVAPPKSKRGKAKPSQLPNRAVPSRAITSPDGADHASGAIQSMSVAPSNSLDDSIGNLVALYRSRLDFVSAKVKIELQIKAMQRREHMRAGCDKPTHAKCPGIYKLETEETSIIRNGALVPMEYQANQRLKAMLAELAEAPLPAGVLDFADNTRGFGRASLAQIIAEAGDLSRYANPAKLWSRMGLGLSPDGSTRYEGRSPRRRAAMFVIGTNFLLARQGPYKDLYDQRKAYERTKPPCGKMLKSAKGEEIGECRDADGANCCKAGHIHKRTQRYVEKRLLRDLWRLWNRNRSDVSQLPVATLSGCAPVATA